MITHRWQVRYSFIDEVTARDRLRDPGRPSAGLWGVRKGRGVSGHHATKARNRHSEIKNKTNVNQACGDHVLAVSQELTSPQIHPLRGVVTIFFYCRFTHFTVKIRIVTFTSRTLAAGA